MRDRKIILPCILLLVISLLLGGISWMTRSVRKKREVSYEQYLREVLLPGSTTFTKENYESDDVNIAAVYRGENGYIIETSVYGYVDMIETWIGVNEDGYVTGLTIRDMNETPGLGKNIINNTSFLLQFLGKTSELTIGEEVDGISGATVSSKTIVKAVNSATAYVTGEDVSSGATKWGS